MITKYIEYIKEGFLQSNVSKLYSFMNNKFKSILKNTDFIIENKFNISLLYKSTVIENKCKRLYSISIFFNNVYYTLRINLLRTIETKEFDTFDEVKKFIDIELSNFYYKVIIDEFSILTNIEKDAYINSLDCVIPLNKEEYSKFIYVLITNKKYNYKELLNNKNIYYKYLTDEYKDKIEYMINANNFNLL